MTITEAKDLFLILYDKVTNLAAPGYEDNEIEEFFDKALLQFVKQHYNYKGNKYKEGVEETEKRRKDLSELVREVTLSGGTGNTSDQSSVLPNGEMFDLPVNFLYTMMEEIIISSTDECVDGNRIRVKPITHDEYTEGVRNPWKKPSLEKAWRLDFSRDEDGANTLRHEIIAGSTYTVDKYYVRYLKIPDNVSIVDNITFELHESVHEEIVDIAVRIAAGITDPQSYQIKQAEQNLTE